MTYAEAKKEFTGKVLFAATEEWFRNCDFGDDECSCCTPECERCSVCRLELKVDAVHSTRRSFLLEFNRIGTTLVVSKDQADDFELPMAEISPELSEQVANLGLELNEERFIYCRVWHGKSRRYQYERDYIYPCDREKANCLLVITRVEGVGFSLISLEDEARHCGTASRLASIDEDGANGDCCLDLWRFCYDPTNDTICVPPEDVDKYIDNLIG